VATVCSPPLRAPLLAPPASAPRLRATACLVASAALHALLVSWLATMSLRVEVSNPVLVRVAILQSTGSGLEDGGGPLLAGPPPILAPAAPVVVAAPPRMPKLEPRRVPSAPRPVAGKEKPKRAVEAAVRAAPAPPAPASGAASATAGDALASNAGDGESGSMPGGGRGRGGPGTGTGSGRGRGAGVGASPLLAYLARVRERVEGAKRYPLLARRWRIEGVAVVRFELDRGGAPHRIEVRHADHPVLGEAALLAVRMASPFGPLPGQIEETTVGVEVPMRFSLKESSE
jgi:TonB family protein